MVHPQLIGNLTAAGARAIVFDLEFFTPEPEFDPALAAAMRASGRVIAGEIEEGATQGGVRDALAAIGNLNVRQYADVPRQVERHHRR